MKKMKQFIYRILTGVMLCCYLTSCDEDQDLCIDLVGSWRGDFGAYYVADNSTDTTYSDISILVFTPQFPDEKYGVCLETDYYPGGKKITTEIDWELIYGKLYMRYREDPEKDMRITHYTLNDSAFFGYLPDDRPFDLHKDK